MKSYVKFTPATTATFTIRLQTARRLQATKYNRWTRRFEILRKQWLSLVQKDDFLVDDSNKLIKEGEAILRLLGPKFEP